MAEIPPPLTPPEHKTRGDQHLAAGDPEQARRSYLACLKQAPGSIGAALGLARAVRDLGRPELAVQVIETALRFNPNHGALLATLGAALTEAGQAERAVDVLRGAVAVDPDDFVALYNLGIAAFSLHDPDASVAAHRAALRLRPDDKDCLTHLLGALLYDSAMSGTQMLTETRSVLAGLGGSRVVWPRPAKDRLRLGWLTSDFRGSHPVAQNTLPLLRALQDFKHVVYSDSGTARPDPMPGQWRDVRGVADADVAEIVRQDEIDILLVLAGRFDENRPLFALRRAAPVQISFHDPATSGLPNMDYIVLDRFIAPRSHRHHFTERVLRLPSFYIREAIPEAPPILPPPILQSGVLTLASFNRPKKINAAVLDLWARMLAEVAGTRLVLKSRQYAVAAVRERTMATFLARGIDPACVELREEDPNWLDHLTSYGGVDLMVDTFPFSGSTTTFEALWMGVPLVTLPGDLAVSRWTGSMLRALKLDSLIAVDPDDYVAIVRRIRDRPEELTALRAGMRERLARSPLCDIDLRARQFGRLLRAAWHARITSPPSAQ